jgi:histidinol-phosphate aminotransferase
MNQSLSLIRQHIQKLPPYQPVYPLDVLAEELGLPTSQLVKLDANENPYGPIPEVLDALANLETVHIYPDPESRRIKSLLASHHGIDPDTIVIGAGADELIDLLMRLILDPDDRLLNCPPTFGMYAFDGELNQAKLITVPRQADFSLDIPAVIQAVQDHKPKMLFLASPNNPDGGLLSRAEFEQLVDLPVLLIVDEAYIEFSNSSSSFLDQVAKRSNLIVLRTFSKWAGLAGLRIGYGVFPKEMVPIIMKAKQPYNVSAAAEAAAVITMQNLTQAQFRINEIIKQRGFLFNQLSELSWLKPYPSMANFILCQVRQGSASLITDQLRRKGILIRYFDRPGLSDHIRFSIGTEAQNKQLLSALQGVNPL